MTEEEKDAYIKKLVQSDVDQQNKICLLSKKVYQLEKENAKVEEIKANADYQLEGRDIEIKELKKQLVEKGQHLDLTEREWGKDLTKMYHYKTQLTKAKELLKKAFEYVSGADDELIDEIKNFINVSESNNNEPDNLCQDCAAFPEMPSGQRCKKCDNGSKFKKQEKSK